MRSLRALLPIFGALVALVPCSGAQEQQVWTGNLPDAAKPLHLQAKEHLVTASEYMSSLLDAIGHRWYSPMTGASANPIVRFVVGRDGRLASVQLERSSGVFAIDQLAMRAVRDSSPVEPFPPTVTGSQVTLHLTFTPRRFSSAWDDSKIKNLNAEGVRRLTATDGSKNPLTALRAFQEAAELGDPTAMTNLAFMYETSQGVPRDEQIAAGWYLRAAELGSEIAEFNLARLYESGRGVPQDTAAALRRYRSVTGSTKTVLAREARSAIERLSR
jgi:TonB family protein